MTRLKLIMKVELIILENSLILLNILLADTKTIYPHYMKMLQELIEKLEIQVKTNNPFHFKTKGEVILESKKSNAIGFGGTNGTNIIFV